MLHHGARNTLHRVQRCHKRHNASSMPQQLDDKLATIPAEDSVFVLQQHGVIALSAVAASAVQCSRMRRYSHLRDDVLRRKNIVVGLVLAYREYHLRARL